VDGLLVAVGLIDIPIGLRHGFWGRAAWPTALFVLAVSIAAAASLPTEALLTPAHWTFGVVGWFGLLLFADRRMRTSGVSSCCTWPRPSRCSPGAGCWPSRWSRWPPSRSAWGRSSSP
jgi:hypothetical protein